MANENEDVKDGIKEDDSPGNEKPEHRSLVGEIIDKIEEVIANMDTDFPLSGGEEHPVHLKHHSDEAKEEQKEDDEKKTSFLEDLDTEFPLSGGEVER